MYDVGGGAKVHVEHSMPRICTGLLFSLVAEQPKKWLDTTECDGARYVVEGDKQGKYRPYEAPPKSRIRIYFSIQPS